MRRRFAIGLGLLCVGVGCDDSDPPGRPASILDLEVERSVARSGVSADVDVVQDNRGMWHIYAATLSDAFRVEGYLMARDRMPQLEFVRRFATGKLAAFAGSVDSTLLESDIVARFEGHARNAQAIFDSLSAEDQHYLEAFSIGVTAYIDQLKSGEEYLPEAVATLLPPEVMQDWTPVDTLAIARYEAAHLSFDLNSATRPPGSTRIARVVCAPMSMTERVPGKRWIAPFATQVMSVIWRSRRGTL